MLRLYTREMWEVGGPFDDVASAVPSYMLYIKATAYQTTYAIKNVVDNAVLLLQDCMQQSVRAVGTLQFSLQILDIGERRSE